MQWAVGKSQFEWLAENKLNQDLFNSYMSCRREGRPNWFSIYPIEQLIRGAVASPDAVFLVDIGGNQGHDLAKFHAQYPSPPGRLVLQDLPNIIANIEKTGIEKIPYSFFDPQPVKSMPQKPEPEIRNIKHILIKIDARAYCFRAILHDWPDRICRRILMNTVSAMKPGYSRIIIVDFVLPETNVPRMQAAMDIQMMSIGAGVERSEQQWRELLLKAGLKIVGIWNVSPNMESIIEAIPAVESE